MTEAEAQLLILRTLGPFICPKCKRNVHIDNVELRKSIISHDGDMADITYTSRCCRIDVHYYEWRLPKKPEDANWNQALDAYWACRYDCRPSPARPGVTDKQLVYGVHP